MAALRPLGIRVYGSEGDVGSDDTVPQTTPLHRTFARRPKLLAARPDRKGSRPTHYNAAGKRGDY